MASFKILDMPYFIFQLLKKANLTLHKYLSKLETYPCQVANIEPKAATVIVDVVSHVEGSGVVGS